MLQRLSVELHAALALLAKILHCVLIRFLSSFVKALGVLCGIFPAWEKTVGIPFPVVKLKQSMIYLHPEPSCLGAWVPGALAKALWKPHVVAKLWTPECGLAARILVTVIVTGVY